MVKPTILYIADLDLKNGGAQRLTFDTLKCLSEDFNLIMYSNTDPSEDFIKLLNELNIQYFIDHSLNEDNVIKVIHNYGVNALLIQWENVTWLKLAASIADKLDIKSIALVHELPYIYIPTTKFIRSFKSLVVLKLFREILRGNLYGRTTLRTILNLDKIVRKMTALICVGDASKYYYSRYLGVDCITITPGIRLPEITSQSYGVSNNDFDYDIAFMSARHEKEKGIFDVVNVVRIVKKSLGRSPKVVVMGKFWFHDVESRFYSMLRKYGLERDFDVLGFVPEDVKYSVLRRSRVFLYPSSKDVFSISLAEALAMGTPAVVYDLPFTRMYNISGVVRVRYRDISGMAREVERLIELSEQNPYEYLSLRKQVAEYVRKTFTIERTCKELKETISKVLK